MSAEFYLNKLYPLQDRVLRLVSGIGSELYLTGGTALGRVYLHHRYSDDIDLFLNWDKGFKAETTKVLDALKTNFQNVDITAQQENFVRAFIRHEDISLKLEFINDVPFHAGDFQSSDIYHKVDGPVNILSNKISALPREASKDVADIIFLCRHISFNWEKIIADARKKDNWVNEVDVSKRIFDFPAENFTEIQWTKAPETSELIKAQKQIAREILKGCDNTLFK